MSVRKIQTRVSNRQQFYHETEGNGGSNLMPNDIIRPPTSHPYSAYKGRNHEQQFNQKYSSNFSFESKVLQKL
jgi:hypothetical protein